MMTSNARTYLSAAKWIAGVIGLVAASYGIYAAVTCIRCGTPKPAEPGDSDSLLNVFMPKDEVVEPHNAHIATPAEVTLATAMNMDL